MKVRLRLVHILLATIFVVAACSRSNNETPTDAGSADTAVETDGTTPGDSGGPAPDSGDTGPEEDLGSAPDSGTISLQLIGVSGEVVDSGSASLGDRTESIVGGSVTFDDVPAGEQVVVIRAAGFAPASVPIDLQSENVSIRRLLVPVRAEIDFDAGVGANLNVDGVRVEIAPDQLVDSAGNPVTGNVTAFVTPLDPAEQLRAAPGPMSGQAADDQDVLLKSVFMADVRFQQGDEPLQLADGTDAVLELPVPDDAPVDVGDTVPAWHFDLEAGSWVEEGAGTVVDVQGRKVWRTSVSHFTWWNIDIPEGETNCVQIRVVDEVGNAVDDAFITIVSRESNFVNISEVIFSGYACLDFPTGETVDIYVESPLGFADVESSSGGQGAPSCSDDALGCEQLTIRLDPPACITGSVVEMGVPVEGVDVLASFDSGASFAITDAAGEYCLRVGQGETAEVRAFHADDQGVAFLASTVVDAPTDEGLCGGDACGEVPPLELSPSPGICITGVARHETAGGSADVPPGTPLVAMAEGTFTGVDCSVPPAAWGEVVGSGVVGADGEYCMDLLFDSGASGYDIVVDYCRLPECFTDFPTYCEASAVYQRPMNASQGTSCGTSASSCFSADFLFFPPA